MGEILIGLSSWADKSLIACGKFYPPDANDAASRLQYYASQFPRLVEVNSTYYGLPAAASARLWVERTPPRFQFDVKMFSLLTQHPTAVKSLPRDLRESLPAEVADKENIYLRDVPAEVAEEVLRRYVAALQPLHAAGKLGAVLTQFPHWFTPGDAARAHIAWLRDRLAGYLVAVEFRNNQWLNPANLEDTLDWLAAHELTYVAVDEPQGFRASVPPVAAVTNSALAYVRFHGRRREVWAERGVSVQEKFKYLYSANELKEWVLKLEEMAEQAAVVHVLMNTNYEDYAVRNARQLSLLLHEAGVETA